LLSHAPIVKNAKDKIIPKEGQFTQGGGGGEDYTDRAECQKELNDLVNVCFGQNVKIDFTQFKEITEKVTSEMFFCIFSLIMTHFPSLSMFKRYEQGLKKKALLMSPSSSRRVAPAKILSKFSGMSQMVKFSTPKLESRTLRVQRAEEEENVEETKNPTVQRPYLSKLSNKPKSSFAPNSNMPGSPGITAAVRLPNAKIKAQEVINSPSTFLKGDKTERLVLFCECGKEISDFDKLLCKDCSSKLTQPKCEGYLTRKTKKGIKKYWMCIEKKELFCMFRYNIML
jgi:hypothetical protein